MKVDVGGSLGNFVLIETLWNVNVLPAAFPAVPALVLIETLWNVNLCPFVDFFARLRVLIETLWNVNIFPEFFLCPGNFRFNRNIVECK